MITCTFENGNVAKVGLRHVTVGAILLRDDKVLLGMRAEVPGLNMLEVGKWALLGGYFDRDETLTEAVRREVMEESGWEIDSLELFRINDSPLRPMEDRQNVDLIFIAKAVNQTSQNDREIKELRWFNLNELPPREEIAFDHGDDLDLFIKHLESPRQLPILG